MTFWWVKYRLIGVHNQWIIQDVLRNLWYISKGRLAIVNTCLYESGVNICMMHGQCLSLILTPSRRSSTSYNLCLISCRAKCCYHGIRSFWTLLVRPCESKFPQGTIFHSTIFQPLSVYHHLRKWLHFTNSFPSVWKIKQSFFAFCLFCS